MRPSASTSGRDPSASSRLRVSPTGLFWYPDVVVVCGELQFWGAEKDTVTNPLLVVEFLSPSTEGWGRGGKFARYRMLESLREVVFVSQDRVLVEQFTRQDDGRWILTEATRLDEVLPLASLACDLPVSETGSAHQTTGEARSPGVRLRRGV